MRQRTIVVWLGSITALVLASIAGLAMSDQTAIFRVSLGLAMAAALLSLLAVPFFLVGLKRFKLELRHAYGVLSLGIGIFGLAQVQLPFVNFYNTNFWIDSGAIAIPYLAGAICIFWGMRMLTRLLSIKTQWASWVLPLLSAAVLALAISFVPHVAVATDELTYDFALGLTVWNTVFVGFAAVLVYKVRQKIGPSYARSMNILFGALCILVFAGVHYLAVQLLFTIGDWYIDYSIAIVPFIAGALAFVIAGYTFDSTDTQPENRASPEAKKQDESAPRELIDALSPSQELEVVLYVTNLVSNPTDIDTAVNELRMIAARTQPGQAPSFDDQKRVDAIYARLEDYLLHRDPLRVFTQDELHGRIAKRFGLSNNVKTTLWHHGQ